MKAVDLKPRRGNGTSDNRDSANYKGDTLKRCPDEPGLEGWTVVGSRPAEWEWTMPEPGGCDEFVLLKLERYYPPYTVTGDTTTARLLQTRTAWLSSQSEVDVEPR